MDSKRMTVDFNTALDSCLLARQIAGKACSAFAKETLADIGKVIRLFSRKDEPTYPNSFADKEFFDEEVALAFGATLGIYAVQLYDLIDNVVMPHDDHIRYQILHRIEGYGEIAEKIDGFSINAERFRSDPGYRNDPFVRGYTMGLETSSQEFNTVYNLLPWKENYTLANAFVRGHAARSIYHGIPQTVFGISLVITENPRMIRFYYSYRASTDDLQDRDMKLLFQIILTPGISQFQVQKIFWKELGDPAQKVF